MNQLNQIKGAHLSIAIDSKINILFLFNKKKEGKITKTRNLSMTTIFLEFETLGEKGAYELSVLRFRLYKEG